MAQWQMQSLARPRGYRGRAALAVAALCAALGVGGCAGSATTGPSQSGSTQNIPPSSHPPPRDGTPSPVPGTVVLPRSGYPRADLAADRAAGSVLLQAQCASCHALLSAGMGGAGATVGPSLDRIGRKRSRAWLERELVDPCAHRPSHRSRYHCGQMPSYAGLTQQQRDQIVLYLLAQR